MALTFTGIYKQVPIDSKLIIPDVKPSIECIIDTYTQVVIDKEVVIDTPLTYPETENAPPYDQLRKVIVTGMVVVKIKYSALVPDQKVHAAHFEIPFCTLIEWPDGPPQGTPIVVKPVVEKAVYINEDGRRVFKAILIRLEVYR
ncbi:MAG: hypothetical protein XD78_1776 [Desulfotomaculum sp. 46_296]|nr:MAG: hypothetical protein XD78_1776 [Desulfotomaculum sp. 46_296]HAU32377.1 hypothetical protein [Desulfotomaculum sp.]